MAVTKNYEDEHAVAVWSPNMATAIVSMNVVGAVHLLLHVVPDMQGTLTRGYWIIFKKDSWLLARWREKYPNATILGETT